MGYTNATMSECAIHRNFETYLHIPNAAGRFDEGVCRRKEASHCCQISIRLHKNLATHCISLSKRPDNLHLWRLLW